MKRLLYIILILLFFPTLFASVQKMPRDGQKPVLNEDTIQTIINKHYHQYQTLEYFSGLQVSIKKGDQINTYTAGFRSHNKKHPIDKKALFQIGSITKSFTAALALLAEHDGSLALEKPLKHYLSAYPNWQNIQLKQLLNMTSGLPNYSDAPLMNSGFAKNLKRYWNRTELIDLVYTKDFVVPLRIGYDYTNTGYILMDMILTKDGKQSFAQLLQSRLLTPLHLENTFYPIPSTDSDVKKRLVSGYAYNVYTNPELVGQDVRDNDLSWAAAAGGLVANSEDIVRWVDALFLHDKLLNKPQQIKMQSLVSTKTGKAIANVSEKEPKGFGLGVIKAYHKSVGDYWYYEGETLGFRALYMVVPCNHVIIAALMNSATNSDNDHSGQLMINLYQQVMQENPALNHCLSSVHPVAST